GHANGIESRPGTGALRVDVRKAARPGDQAPGKRHARPCAQSRVRKSRPGARSPRRAQAERIWRLARGDCARSRLNGCRRGGGAAPTPRPVTYCSAFFPCFTTNRFGATFLHAASTTARDRAAFTRFKCTSVNPCCYHAFSENAS